MTSPYISVVMAVYDSAATISRALDSVVAQTYPDIECIVVDGGSTDGTLEIVAQYGDRIWCSSEPDKGLYDAMNKGVRRATGDWIHLLNSDDAYVDERVWERVVPQLVQEVTNHCSVEVVRSAGESHRARFVGPAWRLMVAADLPHAGLVVSREQYDAIGLYDAELQIAADHDLILRLLERYPSHPIDLPLVRMYQGGVSARRPVEGYAEFRDVTMRHGLPRPLAEAIYWAKRLRFHPRSVLRPPGPIA